MVLPAAPDFRVGSPAGAAEVDAVGGPAPIGFADIIERVTPAVVDVRVKIEETAHSDESQQKSPFPPGSPFDRFFRQFGIPLPEKPSRLTPSIRFRPTHPLSSAIELTTIQSRAFA